MVKKPLYCVLDGCTAHNIVLVSSIDEGINNWKARSLSLFQQETPSKVDVFQKKRDIKFFKGILSCFITSKKSFFLDTILEI